MLLTYSPSRCDAALLRRLTVGRSREILIETLVDAVRGELGAGVHQHQLLTGPRGSGKTHVLAVVADRLESDPELGRRVLPVPLAEEEVAAQPADLVIKILERLESRLAGSDGVKGRSQALAACRDVHHRLRSEHDDDLALTLAAGTLEEIADMLDRLVVPLVENLDQLFYAGYSRNKAIRAQWALRKILMESKGLMLLASAPSLFGEVADEGAPFYGFFRTHSLGELPPADMLALIRRRIEVELGHGEPDGATERRLQTLLANFDRRSARLRGLLVMTGGLPRFAHLLFDLLTETDVASVAGMLDRFLDTQTPYFQSRLDPRIVPQAELEVLEALATADGPLLLSEITAEVRGAVTGNVSNYLKRLRQRGLVRQSGRRQEVRYDLTEPLFRVWRRFRIGPSERERIVTLAELVAAMFEPVELQAEHRDLADQPEGNFRRRVVEQALAEAGPPPELIEPEEVYGIGDPEQAAEQIRRREAEIEQGRREMEELREAQASPEAPRVIFSVSDNTFQRLAKLVRHADQEGVRRGLIRFCVAALAEPAKLLEWLPLLEVELPASRRDLLRPIRLAVEILAERENPELPGEPEEMRRVVTELLERSNEKISYRVERADLASELLQSLVERPTSEALDALWALRVELEQEDPENARWIVDEALAACARQGEDWVRQAIRKADPAAEPVHELAYLLTELENGRPLWFELKEDFFAKVSENHERSIATCLEFFHDDAHIDWLAARVDREDDFLGAAARRALFLLRPGDPPDPVDDEASDELFWAGNWWLLPHFNAGSTEAENLITEEVMKSDDPLRVALRLAGFENRITPDTLDRLLDAATERLADVLAEPSEDNRALLPKPFFPLAEIRRLSLVERFEARRGTELEHLLSRWLCERGPNNGNIRRRREETAIRVLKKIGGEALTRVAHHYLCNGRTWWALLEAVDLAVMRPDQRTADLLFEVAMREAVKGLEHAIAQVAAVGALVTIGRLDLALRGAMKWGPKLSREVVALFGEHPPTENDVQPVLDALRAPDGPDPEAIFAIGLTGQKEQVRQLHSILDTSPKGSELSRGCLFALWLMGDCSPATVEAFVDNLQVPENEHVSWHALFDIHTPKAFEALKGRLSGLNKHRLSTSDNAVLIAANLLLAEETSREVAEFLWTELGSHSIPFVAMGELEPFAKLDRQDVRDWLWDLALGHQPAFGAQLEAIRVLARGDADRAFDAAVRLLAPDDRNREDAPSLMIEINSDRALPILREQVEAENSVAVLAAIGEAVGLAGKLSALIGWLEDPSPGVREGACIAAEVLPWTDDLAHVLRQRLYDEAWSVRAAANQALDRIWHAREMDRLVDEILAETDGTRRWCLLDVLLEGGHPGLAGSFRQQPWVTRLFDHLPLEMRQRAIDRLKKRRKELRDELRKRRRST